MGFGTFTISNFGPSAPSGYGNSCIRIFVVRNLRRFLFSTIRSNVYYSRTSFLNSQLDLRVEKRLVG